MPRNRTDLTTTPPVEATVPAIPDDVRADLLRAQGAALEGSVATLPRVKILGAGAGLYEFEGEDNTVRTFDGVVLSYHAQNVLWDKPYGTPRDDSDPTSALPACQSPDAVTGAIRTGFAHVALGGAVAEENAVALCKSCGYNKWESAPLIGRQGKGKACTNQIALYIMLADRAMPVELVLSPTSLTAWTEYLTSLLNRQTPVQAVLTKFAQVKKERNGLVWAQATFAEVRPLSLDEFNEVMARKETFADAMQPRRITVVDDSGAPTF